MSFHLVVTEAFDGYVRGQEITDASTVEAILAGANAHDVVKRDAGVVPGADPDFAQKVSDLLASTPAA